MGKTYVGIVGLLGYIISVVAIIETGHQCKCSERVSGTNSLGHVFTAGPTRFLAAVGVTQFGRSEDISLKYFVGAGRLGAEERGGEVTVLPIPQTDVASLLRDPQVQNSWVRVPWPAQPQLQGSHQFLRRLESCLHRWQRALLPLVVQI